MVVKYGHLEKHSMGFKINVDHDVIDKKGMVEYEYKNRTHKSRYFKSTCFIKGT